MPVSNFLPNRRNAAVKPTQHFWRPLGLLLLPLLLLSSCINRQQFNDQDLREDSRANLRVHNNLDNSLWLYVDSTFLKVVPGLTIFDVRIDGELAEQRRLDVYQADEDYNPYRGLPDYPAYNTINVQFNDTVVDWYLTRGQENCADETGTLSLFFPYAADSVRGSIRANSPYTVRIQANSFNGPLLTTLSPDEPLQTTCYDFVDVLSLYLTYQVEDNTGQLRTVDSLPNSRTNSTIQTTLNAFVNYRNVQIPTLEESGLYSPLLVRNQSSQLVGLRYNGQDLTRALIKPPGFNPDNTAFTLAPGDQVDTYIQRGDYLVEAFDPLSGNTLQTISIQASSTDTVLLDIN